MASAGSTCATTWVATTQVNQTVADTICANYDYTDPNSLKSFNEMIWTQNTTAQTEFCSTYGITAIQLYYYTGQVGLSGTWGDYYYASMADISDHYGCTGMSGGVANCTAEELASLQWGSLGVTNNTKESWGTYYTPNATTVAGWGNQPTWLPYGPLTDAPEYPQNTAAQPQDYSFI